MNPLRLLFPALLSAASLYATDPNVLTPAERAEGWTLLFDGQSLAGWRSLKSEQPGAGWQVADGAITLTGKPGDLVSAAAYGDFEFSFEWRVSETANSGVIYRVGLDEAQTFLTGPEYQVLDNAKAKDNKLANHLAASIYDVAAPPADYTKPVGEWNTGKVVVRGWHVEHWLNGHRVVDLDLASPEGRAAIAASKFKKWATFATLARGHLALQDHGHAVGYRALKVRELK